jgi:hypothetical protein
MKTCRVILRSLVCLASLGVSALSGNVMADTVTAQGVLADAVSAANRIDDAGVKAHVLDLIAAAQAECGDGASARQTAGSIVVNADDPGNAQAETGWKNDAYAAIVGGQAECGDIDRARAAAAQFADADVKSLAYQYIAQDLAKTGRRSEAREFAGRCGGVDRARADGAIAVADAAAGNFDDAKAEATSLGDPSEQVQALTRIAELQAKAGDVNSARQTIELAKSAAAQVPQWLARATYGAIAAAMVWAGEVDDANALRKIDENYVVRKIAVAQADMGDISAARATIAQISDAAGLACANARVAVALWKAGHAADANDALDAVRYAASQIGDSSQAADAAGIIAAAQTQVGDASSAADWGRAQQDPFVGASALIAVAKALPR